MSNRISVVNSYKDVIKRYKNLFEKEIIDLPNNIPKYRVNCKSINEEKNKIIILISELYSDIGKSDEARIILNNKFFNKELPEFIILYNIEKTNSIKRVNNYVPNSINFLLNNIENFNHIVYKDNSHKKGSTSEIYSSQQRHLFPFRN